MNLVQNSQALIDPGVKITFRQHTISNKITPIKNRTMTFLDAKIYYILRLIFDIV